MLIAGAVTLQDIWVAAPQQVLHLRFQFSADAVSPKSPPVRAALIWPSKVPPVMSGVGAGRTLAMEIQLTTDLLRC